MNTALGGTFEKLHSGHKFLLDIACMLSTKVYIGLTSDEFAKKSKGREVAPYEEREKALLEYLQGKNVEISKLSDIYGVSVLMAELDMIAVSTETYPNACRINRKREELGKKPLIIVSVPIIKNNHGSKLSARDLIGVQHQNTRGTEEE